MRHRLLSVAVASFVAASSLLPSPATGAQCSVDQPVDAVEAAFVQCTGVHPGMGIIAKSNRGWASCTAGFAFADQYGNRYLSIPGSCVLIGECRWPQLLDRVPEIVKEIAHGLLCEYVPHHEEKKYKKPALVTNDHGARIGVVTYAVNLPSPPGRSFEEWDFALVRLDKGVKLDPALPFFGGPTRIGDFLEEPDEAFAFSAFDERTSLPNVRKAPLLQFPVRPSGPSGGQARFHHSGAHWYSGRIVGTPVMRTDGTALGFYSRDSTSVLGYETVGSYKRFVARAEKFTGLRLRLLTAPLAR
jgi:hypothetical protein